MNNIDIKCSGNYYFKAISASGLESDIKSFPINIEHPVSTNINIATDYKFNSWSQKDVSLNLSGGIEDLNMISNYQYSTNGTDWKDVDNNNILTISSNSSVDKYYFRVISKGGSILSQTSDYIVKIDKEKPVLILSGYEGTVIDKDVTIDVSNNSKNISAIKYEYKIGTDEWKTLDGTSLVLKAPYSGDVIFKATAENGLEDTKTINVDIRKTEYFTVTFLDNNGKLINTQSIEKGKGASAPTAPIMEGLNFIGWNKKFDNILENTEIIAQYNPKQVNVVFKGKNGEILKSELVDCGKSATAPTVPNIEGFNFIGWDKDTSSIKEDMVITAKYDVKQEAPTGDIATVMPLIATITAGLGMLLGKRK